MKLLAIGDMHLGRQPSGLPQALQPQGREYGPANAWRRAVDLAIAQEVDVVALAGDLVEREDDFFEAHRLLKVQIERLVEAGIAVVGVAGNHDVQVLPRLADELPDFILLGRGGRWESRSFSNGSQRLTLHGWSFSEQHVRHSPLAGQSFNRVEGLNLGLLHCDRDQRGSKYAPVTTAELESAGLDGWLLGHIHRPDALIAPRPVGYLGSLTGLHPGEHGPRGPWLMLIEHDRIASMEQQLIAPLHWHRLDLDLSELKRPEEAENLLLQALRQLNETLDGHVNPPDAVGLRIRLTGRTQLANEVLELLEDSQGEDISDDPARYVFVEKVVSDTRPVQELGALAEESNYIGLLARRLMLLEGAEEDASRRALIDDARQKLKGCAEERRWHGLVPPEFDDEEVAWRIADVGSRLLERLISQREKRS